SPGFPRTLGQAKALDGICQLDLVISLNIPFETLKDRLSARWVHPASGRVYNMDFNPPHVQVGAALGATRTGKTSGMLLQALSQLPWDGLVLTSPTFFFSRSRGILHSFSGTETNKIWPYVYTLLSSRIPPILPDEEH
ncbi:KAD4 kinase, partial [Erythrocercus mccallii]|nr:KAD4 kinase [Erythrocercus mccallii]